MTLILSMKKEKLWETWKVRGILMLFLPFLPCRLTQKRKKNKQRQYQRIQTWTHAVVSPVGQWGNPNIPDANGVVTYCTQVHILLALSFSRCFALKAGRLLNKKSYSNLECNLKVNKSYRIVFLDRNVGGNPTYWKLQDAGQMFVIHFVLLYLVIPYVM